MRGALDALEEMFNLDLRRMHRVVVAADFDEALKELSTQTASGNPIAYTNEDYALGVAKVLMLPHEAGAEVVPVLNANFAVGLVLVEETPGETFKWVAHMLHHELCHVHDHNGFIDAFSDQLFHPYGDAKMGETYGSANACWAEYSANRRCAVSAQRADVETTAQTFLSALLRTKDLVDSSICDYRYHADISRLMDEFERHGGFLLRSAAYLLGYLDGLDRTLAEVSVGAQRELTGSYFESTFTAIAERFRELWTQRDTVGWESLSDFENLATVVDDYYSIMGLELELMPDGSLYVGVPFRPETTPGW